MVYIVYVLYYIYYVYMEPIQIDIYWVRHSIDLDQVCPKELMETNFKWQSYISISVIREIARVKWWTIKYNNVSSKEIDGGKTTMFTWEIHLAIWPSPDDILFGVASDTYPTSQLSKTCFPNVARIQALAVKNALKRKYRFFETDLLTAEQASEKGLDTIVTKTVGQKDTTQTADGNIKTTIIEAINSATSKNDFNTIATEIMSLYEQWRLSTQDKADIQIVYNKKYNTL